MLAAPPHTGVACVYVAHMVIECAYDIGDCAIACHVNREDHCRHFNNFLYEGAVAMEVGRFGRTERNAAHVQLGKIIGNEDRSSA